MLFLFSLLAALFYEHRGYRTTGHGIIDLENDIKLVFEKMEKRLRHLQSLEIDFIRIKICFSYS